MASSSTTTLFLRGVPRAVIRVAKAEAARRGQPLGVIVSDAVRVALSQEQAEANHDLTADMAWYESHRQRLERHYRHQYVAVVEQRVVDHDGDFASLAKRVYAKYGVRSIFIPQVGGMRRVHLPSPRVRRA